MFSAWLNDLRHTTSFRLALLFLVLFGTASLIVFGFVYWKTAGYLSRDVDNGLAREVTVRVGKRAADLEWQFNARAPLDPAGHRPFAMFDATGHWKAGTRATLPFPPPPLDQPFDFTLPRDGEAVPYRGLLHRLESGELFLVAQEMSKINRFRDLLAAAMISGGLAVLVIGLAGGLIAGAGALGRLNRVTQAMERIVNGDLRERLPSGGDSGDIDRLIQVVNRMLDDIERLMHEVKGVTDEIAHDLRTPLTRLLAGLERASRRGGAAEDYAVAVDEAIVETRGILATFGALLRIAEVEAGARRAGFTLLDLNTVAEDVVDFYEPLAERKGVSLSLDMAPTPTELSGDASLLFEAIGNLVDNAIKFTPAGGSIALRVAASAERLAIEVSDTGPGIPEAERVKVLQRFHRAEKSRHTPGSGLGLSLVAAVARLHCLHLAVEDADPGCRIVLWREPDPPGTEPTASPAQAAASSDVRIAHSAAR